MRPHDAKPEGLRKLSLTQEEPPYELGQNGSQIARTYYKIFGGTPEQYTIDNIFLLNMMTK